MIDQVHAIFYHVTIEHVMPGAGQQGSDISFRVTSNAKVKRPEVSEGYVIGEQQECSAIQSAGGRG